LKQNLTHILFDFFGTLVTYSESRVEHSQSYKLLVDNGSAITYQTFLNEWDRLFGEFEQQSALSLNEFSMTEICECFTRKILGKAPKFELIESFRDTFISEWSQGVNYILGVNEMLDALSANYTLVLVSNTHHAKLVQDHLRNSGMERYFDYVITSVEHGRRKPSRSIFEHALLSSNGLKEAVLFVGDSYVLDYQGALAAGIPSLLIDPEKRYDVPNSLRLNGILELPSAKLLANQANAADARTSHG
jgi:putative hydrolase of the HAD superfamily